MSVPQPWKGSPRAEHYEIPGPRYSMPRRMANPIATPEKRRVIDFEAVKHLLLARIEKRPARLDLTRYPHLPQPFVAATRAGDYAIGGAKAWIAIAVMG